MYIHKTLQTTLGISVVKEYIHNACMSKGSIDASFKN
jgi:hypothetical protein